MTAKAKIFVFLAVKSILAQTKLQKEMGLFEVYKRDLLEEADTHMFVHIMHVSLIGSPTLMIFNSDTDVAVLDIACMLI